MFKHLLKVNSRLNWPVGILAATAGSVVFYTNASSSKIWNDEPINVDASPLITQSELSKHNRMGDIWVSIHGHVYDVSEFIESHPGGVDKLMKFAGKDGTRGFRMQHPEVYLERFLDQDWYKGELVKEAKKDTKKKKETDTIEGIKIGKRIAGSSDEEYYKALVKEHIKPIKVKKAKLSESERLITYSDEQKPHISQIFNLSDFETVAKHLLPPLVYSFIQSGSDNEYSVLENRRALGRIFFRPKCLVDVENNSSKSNVLGCSIDVPFIIGTLNGSDLMNGKGDDNFVIECANDSGILPMVSNASHISLDDVAQRNSSILYQFSIDSKESLASAGEDMKQLYKKYPNIKAFFISIDAPVRGNIEHFKKLEAMGHQESNHPSPQIHTREFGLTWDDLNKIQVESNNAPIVIKGIQRVDDVIRCQKMGFKGALISNHCGKTLDQGLSPIEILFKVNQYFKNEKVHSGFDLFVEGGFRRGSDVLKAVCLGATPVISKPILFSELYGKEGVQKSIDIMKSEIIRDMKFLGVNNLSELDSSFLDCESLNFRITTKDSDYLYGSNYTNMPAPPFKNANNLKFV